MAVDKKTIGISSLVSLLLVLGITIGPTFFETPMYYCESESSILECPGGLSGGSATRCYLNEEKSSWDYCSGGWYEITDDRPIQEEPRDYPDVIKGSRVWECSYTGCIEVTE